MENSPLVSIYIPTKNRLALLTRAVESVLAQSYTNWELIVVNDASTDDTYNYLESIKSKKITVIHQNISQGACVARNIAIANASGEFITGLDDDDYFEANRLFDFINCWSQKHNNVVLLYSNNKLISDNKIYHTSDRGEIARRINLLKRNRIGNQIFTTLENMKMIGGFDTKLLMWQDFDCWYRLLEYGNGQLVENASYVTDVSIRTDRITINNSEKLLITYKYFCKKHKLALMERWLLLGHFAQYDQFQKRSYRLKLKIARIYYKNII